MSRCSEDVIHKHRLGRCLEFVNLRVSVGFDIPSMAATYLWQRVRDPAEKDWRISDEQLVEMLENDH